jgi:hypothetical protein
MTKDIPTPAQLRKLLTYDPDTGDLTWKVRDVDLFMSVQQCNAWNGKHAGKPAFTSNHNEGYKVGGVFGKVYLAHRVAYAIHHGSWPVDQIDHLNHNRDDNRINNLVEATSLTNGKNQSTPSDNTSGTMGVCWCKRTNKWKVRIHVNGKSISLGYHHSKCEAIAARKAAELEHGYHVNHGAAV